MDVVVAVFGPLEQLFADQHLDDLERLSRSEGVPDGDLDAERAVEAGELQVSNSS